MFLKQCTTVTVESTKLLLLWCSSTPVTRPFRTRPHLSSTLPATTTTGLFASFDHDKSTTDYDSYCLFGFLFFLLLSFSPLSLLVADSQLDPPALNHPPPPLRPLRSLYRHFDPHN